VSVRGIGRTLAIASSRRGATPWRGCAGPSGAGKQVRAGRSRAPVRRGIRGEYMTLGGRRACGSRRTATPRKPRERGGLLGPATLCDIASSPRSTTALRTSQAIDRNVQHAADYRYCSSRSSCASSVSWRSLACVLTLLRSRTGLGIVPPRSLHAAHPCFAADRSGVLAAGFVRRGPPAVGSGRP